MKKKLGFTLIELLVVIAVISILISLALVSLGTAQKQGRDTRRKSDLAQYRNGLEAYAANSGGKYPGWVGAGSTFVAISTSNLCSASSNPGSILTLLSNVCLADPKDVGTCGGTANDFRYCYISDGSAGLANAINYILFSQLETGYWWEVCSNGRVGRVTSVPADITCDVT